MRGLDLLQLLQDYNKNTLVQVRILGQPQNIDGFEYVENDDEPQLLVRPKTGGKPLYLWEVRLLIDQKAWRKAYVYAVEADDLRPLFGFQTTAKSLVLN